LIELPFQTRNKQGGIRWQTGKKIKVTKERVAEAANSPAAVRVAVDRDNRLAAVTVVAADNPVDNVAAAEAVATVKLVFSYLAR